MHVCGRVTIWVYPTHAEAIAATSSVARRRRNTYPLVA
ncbi:hypothetical protein SEA_FAITH5X5_69 [Gordonia phage Faith5x5]|nr:hypothetical protein SEA_FAITH5X5_69 [Gordonia phage Faith5x5]